VRNGTAEERESRGRTLRRWIDLGSRTKESDQRGSLKGKSKTTAKKNEKPEEKKGLTSARLQQDQGKISRGDTKK